MSAVQTPKQGDTLSFCAAQLTKRDPLHYHNVEKFLFDFGSQKTDIRPRELCTGRWTPDEHKAYVEVIRMRLNKKELQRRLVEQITTRTDSQIRAHHQKMLKKYRTLEEIERTDMVDIPGMKEIVPKLDRVINLLRSLTEGSLESPAMEVDDPFKGVSVVEENELLTSPFKRLRSF